MLRVFGIFLSVFWLVGLVVHLDGLAHLFRRSGGAESCDSPNGENAGCFPIPPQSPSNLELLEAV
jgi:hypothetical protein